MSLLEKSRWARTPKKPRNQWREYPISEGTMTDLLSSFLASVNSIPDAMDVDKVIVGDVHNGLYTLAVAFKKGKEV